MTSTLQVLTVPQLCSTLEVLQKSSARIVENLLGRIEMLQRLAQLLEFRVDTSAIPDVSQLIPIGLVNTDVVAQLQASCPGAFPGANAVYSAQQQVYALQNALFNSYAQILKDLDNSPLGSMNRLQNAANDIAGEAQDALAGAYGQALHIFSCLQAICTAGEYITDLPSQTVQDILQKYNQALELGNKSFSIIPTNSEAAYTQFTSARSAVENLVTNLPGDFSPTG